MAETDLPPQVEKFISFGVSEAFNTLLEQFYQTIYQVGIWETFEITGEQTLEQGNCYARYQEFVEQQLEAFCAAEGFSPTDVLQQIQQVKDDTSTVKDFLPSFIQNMDYTSFGKQMKAHALEMTKRAEAASKSASNRVSYLEHSDYSALPVDLSGVWKAHTRYQQQVADNNQLENYLKCLGCPWFARKILKYASNFISNICIVQRETGVSFTYKTLFFGTSSSEVLLNTDHTIDNLWMKPMSTHMRVDPVENAIHSVFWNEDYFSGTGHTRYFRRCNRPEGDVPGDMLMLTDMLHGVPDGAGGAKEVQFSQFFIREDAAP